mgnify:CR=1 FL=1
MSTIEERLEKLETDLTKLIAKSANLFFDINEVLKTLALEVEVLKDEMEMVANIVVPPFVDKVCGENDE